MNLKQKHTTGGGRRFKACFVVLALALAGSMSAQTWTNIGPNEVGWEAVACSADGTKIIAAQPFGRVYLSTNSGGNWTTAPLPSAEWYCTASSADGSKLFASTATSLYVSTNSGLTWATNAVEYGVFRQIACSADGTRVAVASTGEGILCSTDSGATFTTNAVPTGEFGSIVSSADGTELVGMEPYVSRSGLDAAIYRSVDSGVTWTQTGAPLGAWSSLACSADGATIVAVGVGVFGISKNSGVTWVTNPVSLDPALIDCSADGTRLVVAGLPPAGPNNIYTSLDSGQTWVTNNAPGELWSGVAMSADGSVLFDAAYGGVFMAQLPAQPSLSIRPSGTNLTLSWPLPSAGFVLQQSVDLTSTNWANVTNSVTPTNYWNQVTVAPPASGNAFYRLAGP
jgi:hypothetical protein